jgi:ketosteroid isomerase-like protein
MRRCLGEEIVMTQDEMRAVVDAHFVAEDMGDLDAAVAQYTDDVEHDVVGVPGGPLYGRAAARRRYEQLMSQVRTDELTEIHRFYGDDVCVVEHEVTATVTDSFGDLPGGSSIAGSAGGSSIAGSAGGSSIAGSAGGSSIAGSAGGRQVRFRMLHLFQFRAGRISRENVWMDAATIIAQLQAPSSQVAGSRA